MKKSGRQSSNVSVLEPPSVKRSLLGNDYISYPSDLSVTGPGGILDRVISGTRSREQIRERGYEKTGRAMGFGKQLDIIEKRAIPTDDGYTKRPLQKPGRTRWNEN